MVNTICKQKTYKYLLSYSTTERDSLPFETISPRGYQILRLSREETVMCVQKVASKSLRRVPVLSVIMFLF